MYLIAFAYQTRPTYPLIIIANRDEFYERPTAAAAFWEDAPMMLAGRDLKMNGSWMGVSTSGRFAAIAFHQKGTIQLLERTFDTVFEIHP